MKICFIGSGSWSTALAQVASDNNFQVIVYGKDEQEVNDIEKNHRNSKYFKDVELNKRIRATTDMKMAAQNADVIVLAVPSNVIRNVSVELNSIIKAKPIIVNVAKGFDPLTHDRLSTTIQNNFNVGVIKGVVSLIGPSHAEEVILRMFTAISAVCTNHELAHKIQRVFSNNYFRVYTLADEIGAEFGVASKNVIALASGIVNGLGLGDNTRAALMTRGLAEMVRLGVAKDGNEKTFLGLTGIGDLIVTCSSIHSRNFQAGYQIGKADDASLFLKNNEKTVEGVFACKILYEESIKNKISMPIVNAVYQVLYNNIKPSVVLKELMLRELKAEN